MDYSGDYLGSPSRLTTGVVVLFIWLSLYARGDVAAQTADPPLSVKPVVPGQGVTADPPVQGEPIPTQGVTADPPVQGEPIPTQGVTADPPAQQVTVQPAPGVTTDAPRAVTASKPLTVTPLSPIVKQTSGTETPPDPTVTQVGAVSPGGQTSATQVSQLTEGTTQPTTQGSRSNTSTLAETITSTTSIILTVVTSDIPLQSNSSVLNTTTDTPATGAEGATTVELSNNVSSSGVNTTAPPTSPPGLNQTAGGSTQSPPGGVSTDLTTLVEANSTLGPTGLAVNTTSGPSTEVDDSGNTTSTALPPTDVTSPADTSLTTNKTDTNDTTSDMTTSVLSNTTMTTDTVTTPLVMTSPTATLPNTTGNVLTPEIIAEVTSAVTAEVTEVTRVVTSEVTEVTSVVTSEVTEVTGGINNISTILSSLATPPSTDIASTQTTTFQTSIPTTFSTTTSATTTTTTILPTTTMPPSSTTETTVDTIQTTIRSSVASINETTIGLVPDVTTEGNVTSYPPPAGSGSDLWVVVIGVAGGVLLILLVLLLVWCIRKKRREREKKKRYLRDDENVMDYAYHPRRPNTGPIPDGPTKNGVGPRHSGFHDNPTLSPQDEGDKEHSHTEVDPTTKPAVRNYFHDGLRARESLDSSDPALDSLDRERPGMFEKNDVVRREKKPSFPMRAISAKSRISMGPIMLGEMDPDTQPSTQKTYDKMYSGHSTFKK